VPSPHLSRLSNRCSRSHRQCYRPQPDGSLGHIGGTEHRAALINSGQSRYRIDLVEGSLRTRAAGPKPACFALLRVRQRFGPILAQVVTTSSLPQGRPAANNRGKLIDRHSSRAQHYAARRGRISVEGVK
jgi:hypothetical protein